MFAVPDSLTVKTAKSFFQYVMRVHDGEISHRDSELISKSAIKFLIKHNILIDTGTTFVATQTAQAAYREANRVQEEIAINSIKKKLRRREIDLSLI